MNQTPQVDQLEEAILDKLPDDAIRELANLADLEGDHNAEIQAILDEYGVNVKQVAKELFDKEENE